MCLEDTARIPLRARDGSLRAYALVDAADAAWANQFRWCLLRAGYAVRGERVDGRNRMVYLHRALLGLAYGDSQEVDHRNLDRLDNRRSNLRIATRGEQMQNQPSRGGASQARGVAWDKARSRWAATVQINGRTIHLGRFKTEADAAKAARQARLRLMPFATN